MQDIDIYRPYTINEYFQSTVTELFFTILLKLLSFIETVTGKNKLGASDVIDSVLRW
jgi:hypothetical protein